MASSSHSNSPPMKTGAKCFDIYRLPLLPGRFADASEPGRRPERRKGRGGRGDLRWRRGSGLYFLEKGQRQRARDLERTRVNRTIQFPLLPSLDGGAPPLGLIVKNIGPSGQFESSFLLVEDAHDRVRPRTIDWIVAKERFEFTRPLELAENYVTPSRPVLCSRVYLIESAIASPASHSFARRLEGKIQGLGGAGSPNGNS